MHITLSLLAVAGLVILASSASLDAAEAKKPAAAAHDAQIAIGRIEQMPNLPTPFKILDWKQIAADYDRFVFDPTTRGEYLPLVWTDDSRNNIDRPTFGLPTYVGRKKPADHDHEAVTTVAAVLGASLAGIDKTKGEHNWVEMCEAYYVTDPGERLVLNRTTGKSGESFWYDTFAQILFAGLVDRYPQESRLQPAFRGTADRWYEACVAMGAREGKLSFEHTGYRFATMAPHDNGRRTEPEGAAGAAWVQYMAWKKFGDQRHLEGADWCMEWLERHPTNPYYEVVLTYAVTLAARMNAEEGRDYDVEKIVNWCMGPSVARPGWGVIVGRWGDYDVSGLSGSTTDGGGYAFAMNSFVPIGAMLPAARYDDRFARAFGKWALNAINATRLFYPGELPAKFQSCPGWKGDRQGGQGGRGGVICYEGLRREGANYARHLKRREDPASKGKLTKKEEKQWAGIAPYASGDPTAFDWHYHTDLALYGASHVGIYAAMVERTDDEHILALDLLPTDFFHAPAYPTRLIYNPHKAKKTIHIDAGPSPVDLYDTVEKRFLSRNVTGRTAIDLPPDAARVVVLARSGGKETRAGRKLLVDGIVIDHRLAE